MTKFSKLNKQQARSCDEIRRTPNPGGCDSGLWLVSLGQETGAEDKARGQAFRAVVEQGKSAGSDDLTGQ